jgi:Domain of unknown function (DUF3458_C) ARM repeats
MEHLSHICAALQSLVVLKWLGLQAGSNVSGNVTAVTKLLDHAAFNINNPNKCVRLMLGSALLLQHKPAASALLDTPSDVPNVHHVSNICILCCPQLLLPVPRLCSQPRELPRRRRQRLQVHGRRSSEGVRALQFMHVA